jgi:hypothetical protein
MKELHSGEQFQPILDEVKHKKRLSVKRVTVCPNWSYQKYAV